MEGRAAVERRSAAMASSARAASACALRDEGHDRIDARIHALDLGDVAARPHALRVILPAKAGSQPVAGMAQLVRLRSGTAAGVHFSGYRRVDSGQSATDGSAENSSKLGGHRGPQLRIVTRGHPLCALRFALCPALMAPRVAAQLCRPQARVEIREEYISFRASMMRVAA
jgi:hypothetical protein